MEEKHEIRLITALESIAANLSKLLEIIENEEFYVTGDIHTMTEEA